VILALPKNRRAEVERPQMFAPVFNAHRRVDKVIETIRAAIDSRNVLHVTYADDQGRETQRDVRPLAMTFWGAVWTLTAWCELRKGFRNFRLDRIRACAPLDVTFRDEPGKTFADFLRIVAAE